MGMGIVLHRYESAMIVIVGCIVVMGAVIGGFTIAGGQIGAVELQPATAIFP